MIEMLVTPESPPAIASNSSCPLLLWGRQGDPSAVPVGVVAPSDE